MSYGIDYNKLNTALSFKEQESGKNAIDVITEKGTLSFFSSIKSVAMFVNSAYSGSFVSGNIFWTLPVKSLTETYTTGHVVDDVPQLDKVQNDEIYQKIASKVVESFDLEAMGFVGLQIYSLQAQLLAEVMGNYIECKCFKILSDFCDQHPEQTIYIKGLGDKKVFSKEESEQIFSAILFAKTMISKDFTDPHYMGAPMEDFYTVLDTTCFAGLSQALAFNSAYILAADISKKMLEANTSDAAQFVKGKLAMTNILNKNNIGAGVIDKLEDLTIDKKGFLLYKDAYAIVLGVPSFKVLPDPNTQNMKMTMKQQFTTAKLYKNLIFAFVDSFQAGVKGGKVVDYNKDANDGKTTYEVAKGTTIALTSNLVFDADINSVEFDSSNTSIAEVKDGNKLVAKEAGIAVISAAFNNEKPVITFKFKVKVI